MLPVYFEDRLTGRIEAANPGLVFSYAESWMADDTAFAVSLTMPLDKPDHERQVATPWFANLLPEERQLERVGRLLGRSQGDVYGLLEETGRDTAGALSIGGAESIGTAKYRQLDDQALAGVIDRLPERPLLAGEGEVTMSLAGAQSKVAVAVFSGDIYLPLGGAASTHIVKPESERLYASVENELLCMSLARDCGLAVASVEMGLAEGRKFLLVERYDRRVVAAGKVERHHQEDFCQLTSRYPTEKYETDRGPGFRELFETLDRWSSGAARDRLTLLDLTILACCIGDTDRHAKNFSFLLSGGAVRLAPGYDLMSAMLYEGVTRNLAMKVAGRQRAEHLHRRHWERFAAGVGLAPAATANRVEALATRIADRIQAKADELGKATVGDAKAFRLFADRIEERSVQIAANSRRNA